MCYGNQGKEIKHSCAMQEFCELGAKICKPILKQFLSLDFLCSDFEFLIPLPHPFLAQSKHISAHIYGNKSAEHLV